MIYSIYFEWLDSSLQFVEGTVDMSVTEITDSTGRRFDSSLAWLSR